MFAYRLPVVGFKGEQAYLPSLGGVAQFLALVLPVVVLVGLAERPYLQIVRGQTDPAMIRAVAALQRLERLPVDGLRQYYESSLRWVLWYIGAPALLLACAGAAALGRRSVEAALDGRARVSAATVPASVVRLWGLPFLIVAWSVVTVLWDPAVVPWQPLASHRFVPVVLPGLVLLAVWMSSWLVSRAKVYGAARGALGVVGTCCVLALALPPLVTTLNPGLSNSPTSTTTASGVSKLASRVQLRGVGATATYSGEIAAASALCATIGPSASVLVTDAATAATYAPAIRSLCGQPAALVVPGPSAVTRGGTGASGERGPAGRAAPRGARPDTIVGDLPGSVLHRDHAPDRGRCRVADRGPDRDLAGHLHRLAGRAVRRRGVVLPTVARNFRNGHWDPASELAGGRIGADGIRAAEFSAAVTR